MTNKIKMRK